MSTVPFWMNVSRFGVVDSLNSILLWASLREPPKMAWAMSLAISTSKPSTLPVLGFFWPRPGWSNLVPTTILPLACRFAMVEPAANVGLVVVGPDVVLDWPPLLVSVFLSLPHADAISDRPTTAVRTAQPLLRMLLL